MTRIDICDKCEGTIKQGDKSLRYMISNYISENKYDIPSHFHVCEKCSKEFAKYIKRFLKIKKNKEINK